MTSVVAIRPDLVPSPAPEVPRELSFREMADELLLAAQREASGLDALELFAFRDTSGVGRSTIADVRRQCANFLDMSRLLRMLAPHEDFIRSVAARSEAQA